MIFLQPAISSSKKREGPAWLIHLLYAMATIQFVWYYQSKVPSYLDVLKYEQGRERTPFQSRMLMMLVLRWAHGSSVLQHAARYLSASNPLPRSTFVPESILQSLLNTVCVAFAGWVAVRLYQANSSQQILLPYVYPLFLLMCTCSYIFHLWADVRFFYDLPALALFSAGLYLIYFHKSPLMFAALFIVATINRETTLFLLLFFILQAAGNRDRVKWRESLTGRTVAVWLPLAAFWVAWRIYVGRLFAHNPLEWFCHYQANIVLLIWPTAWPQLLSAGSYLVPVIYVYRNYIKDPTLRLWLWVLPAWFGVMFLYGLVNETRIYGELTAYLACVAALIAEEAIIKHLREHGELRGPATGYGVALSGRSLTSSLSDNSWIR